MRAALAAFALAAATFALLAAARARADVSLDAARAAPTPTPHTPLGAGCDAALAAAQRKFSDGFRDVDFHVRERRVVGEYRWSDMCGVWGEYSVELAPDHRAAHGWRWVERRAADPPRVHRRGTRRAAALRATFVLDGDSEPSIGDYFVECFQPAVDACLNGSAF
ncbi:MAG TPA: hypothetical protein VF997_02345 [Polyangia bacterium]